MRHGNAHRKLSRNPLTRSRLLNGLATNLFEHERIETTLARAKELKRFADKIITMAKTKTQHNQLRVFEHVLKPAIGTKVITTLAERYKERPGGYTRVWNAGLRKGDKAPTAIIELVDNPFDMKKHFESKKINNDPV